MRKIVVLQNLVEYQESIAAIAPDWELVFTKDKEMAKKHLLNAEILLGWSSDAREICLRENSPLKWVQSWQAGVDDMPLNMLGKREIILTNAGGVHARPISESVFAAMLSLARLVPESLAAQKRSVWKHRELAHTAQQEIHGKVIGVLGTGHIGQEIAKIARAFSMRTLGFRRSEGIAPYFDAIYNPGALHEMLGRCDYVVNVLPLTKDTRGLINKEAFAAMRTGARYFAYGRGETTDTTELELALQVGKLAAAGLDVVAPEPLPASSPLWMMDNVLISPHISGLTPHYFGRVVSIFEENLKEYLAGKTPSINRVNLEQAY